MSREEIAVLLTRLAALFPNFQVTEGTIPAWHLELRDFDAAEISRAVSLYVRTAGSAFAPSVAQLLGVLSAERRAGEKTALEAWQDVIRESGNAYAGRETTLDDRTERALATVGGFKALGLTRDTELPFFRNRFVEAYEAIGDRQAFQGLTALEARTALSAIEAGGRAE